jgi:hypothetical protein
MASAAWAFVLVARLGRGANGHPTALYIAASVVLLLIFLGAKMVRGRRR